MGEEGVLKGLELFLFWNLPSNKLTKLKVLLSFYERARNLTDFSLALALSEIIIVWGPRSQPPSVFFNAGCTLLLRAFGESYTRWDCATVTLHFCRELLILVRDTRRQPDETRDPLTRTSWTMKKSRANEARPQMYILVNLDGELQSVERLVASFTAQMLDGTLHIQAYAFTHTRIRLVYVQL